METRMNYYKLGVQIFKSRWSWPDRCIPRSSLPKLPKKISNSFTGTRKKFWRICGGMKTFDMSE